MDWITKQIAIGDCLDAVNRANDVDTVLCLIANCCEERSDINGCCIPLHDGSGNNREHVLAAIDFIAEQVEKGLKVLVHCRAGRSRSVCVVAAYFIRHQGLSKRQAMAMITKKRQIYLSDGVDEIFKHLREKKHPSLARSMSARFRKFLQKPGSRKR